MLFQALRLGPMPDPRLAAAKARLDTLDFYPHPVQIEGVHLRVSAALFRLPWLRRFDGYATHRVIFVRRADLLDDPDLVCHELCHVWQMQHRPFAMPLSYLRHGYAGNSYEAEARRAAAETARPGGQASASFER